MSRPFMKITKRYSKEAEDIEGKFQGEKPRKNSGEKYKTMDSDKTFVTFDKNSMNKFFHFLIFCADFLAPTKNVNKIVAMDARVTKNQYKKAF